MKKLLTHSISPIIIAGGLILICDFFLLSRPRGLSSTATMPCPLYRLIRKIKWCNDHGSWVMGHKRWPISISEPALAHVWTRLLYSSWTNITFKVTKLSIHVQVLTYRQKIVCGRVVGIPDRLRTEHCESADTSASERAVSKQQQQK